MVGGIYGEGRGRGRGQTPGGVKGDELTSERSSCEGSHAVCRKPSACGAPNAFLGRVARLEAAGGALADGVLADGALRSDGAVRSEGAPATVADVAPPPRSAGGVSCMSGAHHGITAVCESKGALAPAETEDRAPPPAIGTSGAGGMSADISSSDRPSAISAESNDWRHPCGSMLEWTTPVLMSKPRRGRAAGVTARDVGAPSR